jgi:hypothetical protein
MSGEVLREGNKESTGSGGSDPGPFVWNEEAKRSKLVRNFHSVQFDISLQ